MFIHKMGPESDGFKVQKENGSTKAVSTSYQVPPAAFRCSVIEFNFTFTDPLNPLDGFLWIGLW